MDKRTIVIMPGDGIGKVVLDEALRVLEAVGFSANYTLGNIGWGCWTSQGNALPQLTIDLLTKHKIGLFGAITSKPKDEAEKELDPKLQGQGLTYYSPIVTMRQYFNLDFCIRPCQSFSGNPLNFVRREPDGSIIEPKVDVVIFRQNTECLYSGVEWTDPPEEVRKALALHPKFKPFINVPGKELAVSCRIFTQAACDRIMEAAFQYARKNGYRSVTLCEKSNVIRETSGMLLKTALRIRKQYPDITFREVNIDAATMWLTKNPEDFGVIVSGNMFGDIISDGFAGLVGGLGFACSANIGKEVAVFEPTHGSAPKYENLQPSIVNSIAMILSACMMLDHLGENEKSFKIRRAIGAVILDGKVRTYDMLRLPGGPDVFESGAATTQQMTDEIIKNL